MFERHCEVCHAGYNGYQWSYEYDRGAREVCHDCADLYWFLHDLFYAIANRDAFGFHGGTDYAVSSAIW